MARPHLAATIEDLWHRRLERTLRRRGWGTRVLAYTGYGVAAGPDHRTQPGTVRVLGRVLMTRRPYAPAAADAGASWAELRGADLERRGWRSFITAPAMEEPVTVRVGTQTVPARADRSGIIDVTVTGHGLAPGWHEVALTSPRAAEATASVQVLDPAEGFGIVSDIDDTVITTTMPRPLIAAWNTFVRHEGTRRAVPGMATMYRELLAQHPGAAVVYVSTGAWNAVPQLTRFLRRAGYPLGPLLMTDWGPTHTGWFRSGPDHKRACLDRLASELPGVRWLLVGDDGQHDPVIYGSFAARRPDRVRAIAIRTLSATEQILAHGSPLAAEASGEVGVPLRQAADGYAMLEALRGDLGLGGGPLASSPPPVPDPEVRRA